MTSKKYSKNFVVSLVLMPILIQIVIMLVTGNLRTGVAVMGAFSLVRFRSVPGVVINESGVTQNTAPAEDTAEQPL